MFDLWPSSVILLTSLSYQDNLWAYYFNDFVVFIKYNFLSIDINE